MIVTVKQTTYDFNGDLDTTTSEDKEAWRVVPSTKAFEFDGRQFFASWELYFHGDPGITEESLIVINSKDYEVVRIETHYKINSNEVHHTKVIV